MYFNLRNIINPMYSQQPLVFVSLKKEGNLRMILTFRKLQQSQFEVVSKPAVSKRALLYFFLSSQDSTAFRSHNSTEMLISP